MQRLRFVPTWLTSRQTDTDSPWTVYSIVSATWAKNVYVCVLGDLSWSICTINEPSIHSPSGARRPTATQLHPEHRHSGTGGRHHASRPVPWYDRHAFTLLCFYTSAGNEYISFNPLTPELPQHGSPDLELPDTTLFVAVFLRNFRADISALCE